MRLTVRVDFDDGTALGPGKTRLLELVADLGSIRKAAAAMAMSYRQAWLLLQALETTFGAKLVETATGGRAGGGARLTPLGSEVAKTYRKLEISATKAAAKALSRLKSLTADPG